MPSNPQDRSFIDVRQGLQQALTQVQKPARYTGGEYNEVIKDPAGIDVRFAFCFPDTYEIGMSFLGEKILTRYLRVNWWCERAFMPWTDMKAKMEELHIPLLRAGKQGPR